MIIAASIFLLKLNLVIVTGYVLFRVLLRPLTSFKLNRFFLLALPLVGTLFAWLSAQTPVSNTILQYELGNMYVHQLSERVIQTSTVSAMDILQWIYILGVALTGLFVVSGLVTVLRKISSGTPASAMQRQAQHDTSAGKKNYKIVRSGDQSFSFLKWMVLPAANEVDERIVAHEAVHIRQQHSLDILYWETIRIFCWFNPAVHLCIRALKEQHEFLADQGVLENQNEDAPSYARLIVSSALNVSEEMLAPAFMNHSILNSRLKMIGKGTKKGNWRYAMIIFLLLGMVPFMGFINHNSVSTNNRVYTKVDVMPEFPGGQEAFYTYLSSKYSYPEEAKNKGVEGKVFVSFVIDATGQVTNPQILKGIPELNEAALSMFDGMPNWKPAQVDGKPAAIKMTLPILFMLETN